jgi:hypothetical protein
MGHVYRNATIDEGNYMDVEFAVIFVSAGIIGACAALMQVEKKGIAVTKIQVGIFACFGMVWICLLAIFPQKGFWYLIPGIISLGGLSYALSDTTVDKIQGLIARKKVKGAFLSNDTTRGTPGSAQHPPRDEERRAS